MRFRLLLQLCPGFERVGPRLPLTACEELHTLGKGKIERIASLRIPGGCIHSRLARRARSPRLTRCFICRSKSIALSWVKLVALQGALSFTRIFDQLCTDALELCTKGRTMHDLLD